jgi:3beta-hydroxy-delta5-steroid dehydrogenase/steroid delta-isomerase
MPDAPALPSAPVFGPDDVGRVCLVTGGAGYVGSALARRLLASGVEVRTLDVRPSPVPGATHFIADLRDHDAIALAFAGVDTVFHTAALISIVGADLAPPARRRLVYGVNVVGTENVVRVARAAGVRALVHTSSFNVVMNGPIADGSESLPYAPGFDLYTATKAEAERIALAADTESGLRVCALRPGGVWGPGRGAMMIDAFVEQLAKGAFKATIGDGTSVIDNTHVENLVDAELFAAKALREAHELVGGHAYFITDDERINGMEWFRPIVEGLGHRFPAAKLPGRLMYVVAHALEIAHHLGAPEPTLTRRGIRNLTESTSFSIAKARAHLGYAPRYRRAHLATLVPELRARIAAEETERAS